ncbi:MAG: hypothetical protein RIE32_00720 [Phycisphaerales bacterium]
MAIGYVSARQTTELIVRLPQDYAGLLMVVEAAEADANVSIRRGEIELDFTDSTIVRIDDISIFVGRYFRARPLVMNDSGSWTKVGWYFELKQDPGTNVFMIGGHSPRHKSFTLYYCRVQDIDKATDLLRDRELQELLENPALLELK